MTARGGFPSVAALVMTRAQKRLAAENDDADLALNGIKLERRAMEAIGAGKSELDPKELPKGKPLVALREASLYVTTLPKAEHDADEWQAAMSRLPARGKLRNHSLAAMRSISETNWRCTA
jgi:hypothetical protein